MAGTIRIEKSNVVFEISGWDMIFSIKRRITIPLKHITKVTTEEGKWLTGLRMGGTALPYMIKEGRYWWKSTGWQFYLMHDPDKCVSVYLKEEFYKKIVFQVADKEESLKLIKKAMQKKVDTKFED